MKWLSLAVLVGAFSLVHAEDETAPLDNRIAQLGAESYPVRSKAGDEIMKFAATDLEPTAASLLTYSRITMNPEIRRQTRSLLKKIFEVEVLGKGSVDFGIKLGWYLEDNGTKISTLPLILQVIPDGPAAKAGLQVGDVITEMNGKSFEERDAKRAIMKAMTSLPAGKEVVFKIRNNPSTSGAYHLYQRFKKHERKVTPVSYGVLPDNEPFPMQRFLDWLETLPTEPS